MIIILSSAVVPVIILWASGPVGNDNTGHARVRGVARVGTHIFTFPTRSSYHNIRPAQSCPHTKPDDGLQVGPKIFMD